MKLFAPIATSRVNRNGDAVRNDAVKKIAEKHPSFYHFDEQKGRLTVMLEVPVAAKECVNNCNVPV